MTRKDYELVCKALKQEHGYAANWPPQTQGPVRITVENVTRGIADAFGLKDDARALFLKKAGLPSR